MQVPNPSWMNTVLFWWNLDDTCHVVLVVGTLGALCSYTIAYMITLTIFPVEQMQVPNPSWMSTVLFWWNLDDTCHAVLVVGTLGALCSYMCGYMSQTGAQQSQELIGMLRLCCSFLPEIKSNITCMCGLKLQLTQSLNMYLFLMLNLCRRSHFVLVTSIQINLSRCTILLDSISAVNSHNLLFLLCGGS